MQVFLVLVIIGAIKINCAKVPVAQKDFSFFINGKKVDAANDFYGDSQDFQENNFPSSIKYKLGHRENGDSVLIDLRQRREFLSPSNLSAQAIYTNTNWVITAVEAIVSQYPSVSQYVDILDGGIGAQSISVYFQWPNTKRINYLIKVYGRK